MNNVNYQVSEKEQMYLFFRILISSAVYISAAILTYFFFYDEPTKILGTLFFMIPILIMIMCFSILRNGIFIGFIKSQSVLLSENQFPEIYGIVEKQAAGLGLKRVPKIYLLQAGGSLNAFAKKFFNRGYVVVFSDLLEAYYEGDKDAIEFVVAHELGHIKRDHFLKELFLFPSNIIPFISLAYYRGCELTCDNIGHAFNPKGSVRGLIMLAAGKQMSKQINIPEFIEQKKSDSSFWRWFVEKLLLTHPPLYARVERFYTPGKVYSQPKGSVTATINTKVEASKFVTEPEPEIEKPKSDPAADLSRFMPK